jgi:hypothetical protein
MRSWEHVITRRLSLIERTSFEQLTELDRGSDA